MDTDSQLKLNQAMARLGDGDRSASSEVFALLWPALVRFSRRALENGPDADDVAQLALEKIFAQASNYDESCPALAWAFSIASWECRTLITQRRRQAKRLQSLEVAERLPSNENNPEQTALEGRMMMALRESFDSLSAADQIALETTFLDDARAPQSPALRKRKERALSRLRATWRKLYEF